MKVSQYAYNNKFLNDAEVCEVHIYNNHQIENIIENFKSVNNLSNEDFLIFGSSSASYQDYLILNHIRDVDIMMLKNTSVEKTKGVDLLTNIIKLKNYHIQNKNGYQFISKEDFLITSTIQVLFKRKRSDITYVRLMIEDLGLSIDEYISMMNNIIPDLDYSEVYEDRKDLILKRLPLLKNYLGFVD